MFARLGDKRFEASVLDSARRLKRAAEARYRSRVVKTS
jgi:hypothetical protein